MFEAGKKDSFRRVLLIISIAVVSFWIGTESTGMWAEKMKSNTASTTVTVTNLYSPAKKTSVDFDEFWQVWDRVKNNHVNTDIKDSDLFYGAIRGMVAGVGDPHTMYFPPKETEEFKKDLAGEFEGIGAEVGIKDGKLTVTAPPLPASPAEKAGLKTGDQIQKIDGTVTDGLDLDEAVGKIRGPGGTKVALTISRDGQIKQYTITRAKINIPTVRYEAKDDSIAYIRISFFNQDTWREFDKVVRNLIKTPPRGIILDLRSNPGGYLETSVQVASEWVKDGVIVRERLRTLEETVHESEGRHRFAGIKTVVLVDKGTASGSEIVAGALQDYGLATLIGEKTYGKGSVQDFMDLPDGSSLKLTVAKWYTPKERVIDGEGIKPDIEIKEMFVKKEGAVGEESEYEDMGMKKALEILGKK